MSPHNSNKCGTSWLAVGPFGRVTKQLKSFSKFQVLQQQIEFFNSNVFILIHILSSTIKGITLW